VTDDDDADCFQVMRAAVVTIICGKTQDTKCPEY